MHRRTDKWYPRRTSYTCSFFVTPSSRATKFKICQPQVHPRRQPSDHQIYGKMSNRENETETVPNSSGHYMSSKMWEGSRAGSDDIPGSRTPGTYRYRYRFTQLRFRHCRCLRQMLPKIWRRACFEGRASPPSPRGARGAISVRPRPRSARTVPNSVGHRAKP